MRPLAPGRQNDAAPAPTAFVQNSKFVMHFDSAPAPARELMQVLAAPAPTPEIGSYS
jgi:hypothetical protein